MNRIEEVTPQSFKDLIDVLYDGSWDRELLRYRSPFGFRGLSDSGYDLKTSLMRLGGKYPKLEAHLLRNFRKYAELDDADEHFSDWKWLSLAQHHGVATRLLDWTFSPFVALHFATANLAKSETNGVVWCINFRKCAEQLPRKLRSPLAAEGATVYTVGMLTPICRNLTVFDRLSKERFVLFLEPPALDRRIVNQYALFSLMNSAQDRVDDWLEDRPELGRKVIICPRLKWEVRTKLDQANVTERVLFPGLDGLADWLNRHYAPHPKRAAESAPLSLKSRRVGRRK